jgi:hypothetical protein
MQPYPRCSRLAFTLALTAPADVARAGLARAAKAARGFAGVTAWSGIANGLLEADSFGAGLGRPAAIIDAVVEISKDDADDPGPLLAVAIEAHNALIGLYDPARSDVIIGTAHSARSGRSRTAMVMTLCRAVGIDGDFLVRWWETHHSKYNMTSPRGEKCFQQVASYELVNADHNLSRAAGAVLGMRASRDVYESLFINDVEQYFADVAEADFGADNLRDEAGFFSHTWKLGTEPGASVGMGGEKDILYTGLLDVLDDHHASV